MGLSLTRAERRRCRLHGLALGVALVVPVGCNARALEEEPFSADDQGVEGATADDRGEADVDADDDADDDANDDTDDEGMTFGTDDGACGGFVSDCDVPPGDDGTCDFWAQDCPSGEKCTPIASTPGSGAWDAHTCVPAGSHGVGEPCTLEDGSQGADTCDEVSFCYDIDPETTIGTCVGLCQGPESSPTCPAGSGVPGECKKLGGGILNLCLTPCNPLLSGECPTGEACIAAYEGDEPSAPSCQPLDAEGTVGESCDCANCCAQGHECVSAADYGSSCASDRCCTEYCDVSETAFVCAGAGQQCVPLFDPKTPELGNVGRCVLP